MDRKIFVVGDQSEYINWMGGRQVDAIEESDFVLFTGGEDVSPWIYGRNPHPLTSTNPRRDQQEIGMFKSAFEHGKPMVGICRGAQFLCAMSGGILVQHQINPSLYHEVETYDGKKLLMSSTHHQAQYPWLLGEKEYRVLAWSRGASRFHEGSDDKEEMVNGIVPDNKEAEIVSYKAFRCLGIQPHPEMMFPKSKYHTNLYESMLWLRVLLSAHLNDLL